MQIEELVQLAVDALEELKAKVAEQNAKVETSLRLVQSAEANDEEAHQRSNSLAQHLGTIEMGHNADTQILVQTMQTHCGKTTVDLIEQARGTDVLAETSAAQN